MTLERKVGMQHGSKASWVFAGRKDEYKMTNIGFKKDDEKEVDKGLKGVSMVHIVGRNDD